MTPLAPELAISAHQDIRTGILGSELGSRVLILASHPAPKRSNRLRTLITSHIPESHSPAVIDEIVGNTAPVASPEKLVERIPSDTMAWIGAGDLFEAVLSRVSSEEAPDTILCMDPWAAMIVSRVVSASPRSRWVYLSDLEQRASGREKEYWKAVEQWIQALPFERTVTWEALGEPEVPSQESVTPAPPSHRPATAAVAKMPGVPTSPGWRWKSLSPGARDVRVEAPAPLEYLLFSKASLLHLRAALEALAGQDREVGRIPIRIFAQSPARDLELLLKTFSRTCDRFSLTLQPFPSSPEDCVQVVRDVVGSQRAEAIAVLDDTVLIPGNLIRGISSKPFAEHPMICLERVVLPSEAAAHVLAGNLNIVRHYDELLAACQPHSPIPEAPLLLMRAAGRLTDQEVAHTLWAWMKPEERSATRDPHEPRGLVLSLPEEP